MVDNQLTGILDWETARIDHPFWDFDLGEWGTGFWRQRRHDFTRLWSVLWQAYANERGLDEDPAPLETAFRLRQALYLVDNDRDPFVVGTIDGHLDSIYRPTPRDAAQPALEGNFQRAVARAFCDRRLPDPVTSRSPIPGRLSTGLWPERRSCRRIGGMTERISLEGKVAAVTGAGRGLGRAYVELLAERGARVVVNDLGTDVSGFGKDSTIAEQVADLIRTRGGEAIAHDSDVATPEGGRELIATTIEHFGRVDLLVNNAGIL